MYIVCLHVVHFCFTFSNLSFVICKLVFIAVFTVVSYVSLHCMHTVRSLVAAMYAKEWQCFCDDTHVAPVRRTGTFFTLQENLMKNQLKACRLSRSN